MHIATASYKIDIYYAELSFITLKFKILEKWERIENGLNKGFCYQDIDVQKKRFCPQEPHCYKKTKNVRYIMGTVFLRDLSIFIGGLGPVQNVVVHKLFYDEKLIRPKLFSIFQV